MTEHHDTPEVVELRSRLAVAEMSQQLSEAKAESEREVVLDCARALYTARRQHRLDYPIRPPAAGAAATTPAPVTVGVGPIKIGG